MSGVEDKLGREKYIHDETEGLIPWSIKYLWDRMGSRTETFYVKASFLEIYNE